MGRLLFIFLVLISGCSITREIAKQAVVVLNDTATRGAHVGISIYEPATGKYWYQYQADKYFVPASNTKLFSLYTGLKYLGDSLPGLKYFEKKDTIYIEPTGDPTFLHNDFRIQRVFAFLRNKRKPVVINNTSWRTEALGGGWAWDDYNADYMVERSAMPVYGNTIKWTQVKEPSPIGRSKDNFGEGTLVFSQPDVTWKIRLNGDTSNKVFRVVRERSDNIYEISFGNELRRTIEVPIFTNGFSSVVELMSDTLGLKVSSYPVNATYNTLYSQPSDSFYRIMMHRSDNFFAEQTLMMASSIRFGYFDERKMISHILKNDMKEIPQLPKWVDGSGLSRYNLFTPSDFIYILKKLRDEFGMERIKAILPTGGKGTLTQYYKRDSSFIFAKTGTLSNHVALSGYLYTLKGKLLIFSVLVNHSQYGSAGVRKGVEKFLSSIRQRY